MRRRAVLPAARSPANWIGKRANERSPAPVNVPSLLGEGGGGARVISGRETNLRSAEEEHGKTSDRSCDAIAGGGGRAARFFAKGSGGSRDLFSPVTQRRGGGAGGRGQEGAINARDDRTFVGHYLDCDIVTYKIAT